MGFVAGSRVLLWGLFSVAMIGLVDADFVLGRDWEAISTTEQMPAAIDALPVLGEIEWVNERLPFVGPGPKEGVSGAGMVVFEGKIYLMGGFIPGGDEDAKAGVEAGSWRTSNWAHCYDPQTKQWTQLPDMPGRREYTRAIAAKDAVYVMGGASQFKGAEIPYRPFADCFRLDLSQDPPVWTEHSQLTVPRTHMAVGRIEQNLLIVAGGNEYEWELKGYHPKTIRKTVDVFDLTKPERGWQKRKSLPGPRGWSASSVCEGKFYVLGGLSFSESKVQQRHQETYRYDAVNDAWEELAKFALPISGWEAATYDDRYILCVGGVLLPEDRPIRDSTDDLLKDTRWNDVVFAYDTQEDRWYRMDGTLAPRGKFNDAGVCIISKTIYVAGAEGPSGGHYDHFLVGRIRLAE